jgi:hypothetical protein
MLRAPKPESPVLALLALFLWFIVPCADLDRDGFGGCEERAHGCDVFDAASFPVCVDLDGDGVGETAPIAPLCSVAAPGFAPCA